MQVILAEDDEETQAQKFYRVVTKNDLCRFYLEITAYTPESSMYGTNRFGINQSDRSHKLDKTNPNKIFSAVSNTVTQQPVPLFTSSDFMSIVPEYLDFAYLGILFEHRELYYVASPCEFTETDADGGPKIRRGTWRGWMEHGEVGRYLTLEWAALPKGRILGGDDKWGAGMDRQAGSKWHCYNEIIQTLRGQCVEQAKSLCDIYEGPSEGRISPDEPWIRKKLMQDFSVIVDRMHNKLTKKERKVKRETDKLAQKFLAFDEM